MNKDQFLSQLKQGLGDMPEADKQDILYDYEEHFRVGLAEGKSEEKIAESLGNPRTVGSSYRIDAVPSAPKEDVSVAASSASRAVFASIILGFFNVIFVVGPFLGLVGVLIGMWAVPVSLVISGIALIVAPVWPTTTYAVIANPWLNGAFILFLGAGIGALGVLAGIAMLVLTKWFSVGTAWYVRLNARIILGER